MEGSSDFPSHWPCLQGAHCELNNAASTAGSNEGALVGPPSLSESSGRPFSPWFRKLLQRALCIAGSFRPAPHEIPKTKASSAPSQSCTNPFPGLVSPELGFSVTFPSSYFLLGISFLNGFRFTGSCKLESTGNIARKFTCYILSKDRIQFVRTPWLLPGWLVQVTRLCLYPV